MPTITKRILSGSTHGVGLAITQTQGLAPVVVHSLATSATTTLDEIYVYGNNGHTSDINLVFEFGISQSGLQIIQPLPARTGLTLALPGMLLTGSACSVTAFVTGLNGSASPAISGSGLISVFGWVNRIVQS